MTASNGDLFEVPTRDTLAFLAPHLQEPTRILEVGCGAGHLAQALRQRGHDVLALDHDAEAVRLTAARGVRVEQADWPAFEGQPVDVVLFTRSLHHLPDLDAALDRAVALLRPGGRIVAEDYGVTDIDPRGAAWLYSLLRTLDAGGLLVPGAEGFAASLLEHEGDLQAALGSEDLHSAATMEAALGERFDEVMVAAAPYFYRYALPLLTDDERGARILEQLLTSERELLAQGLFAPLGRRFVAS